MWEYVIFLSGSKSVNVFYRLFLYALALENTLSRGDEIPLTSLTPPRFVPVPNQDLHFQRHMA